MRSLTLSKNGINKFRSHQFELKSSDFEGSIKSVPPGEWFCSNLGSGEALIGFINPMIEDKYSCAYVLTKTNSSLLEKFSPEDYINTKIKEAHQRRLKIHGYEKNARLFYGSSDGLPGLIIDQFVNASIIQINTAGLDKYRNEIKKTVSELMETEAFYLDNPKYREKEYLPTFSKDELPDLVIEENKLHYNIRKEVIQKVGFYYDHRENRLQLMNIISRLTTKPKKGIDLFSYVGAWGLNALKAGVTDMEFIDQGDFSLDVEKSLELNGFRDNGRFIRSDVFKYLDSNISANKKFDLILCDPPAFAKSALQKNQALEGYSKLHRKVFKLISSGGLVAFSSCTHYVTHADFEKNISEAANKENKKVRLLYSGLQGFDHPISSQSDKANYIKSYFYIVE